MKKKAAMLLAMGMIFTLCSCVGGSQPESSAAAGRSESQQAPGQSDAPMESEKAENPGELIIYTAAEENVLNLVVPEFEAQTGIKVEIVSAGTGELLKRIEAEQENPLGDIEWGGVVSVIAPQKDLFEPYLSPNEEHIVDFCKNNEGMITRNNVIPFCLLVNTNLISDIKVEGYEDLLNPALKGKIAFPDPAKSSTSVSHLINMLYAMGDGDEEKGWEYVEKFIENLDGKLLAGSSAAPKGVIDGEYTVGLVHEEMASSAIAQGAPVKVVYMEEGVYTSPGTVQIIKGAKNMENAKKFVDFLTSKDLQELTSSKLKMRASRSDVAAPEGLSEISSLKIIDVDTNVVMENNQLWLDRFKDIFVS